MRSFAKKSLPAALALAFAFGPAAIGQAYASDAEGEYHGYLRSGAGTNSKKGSQACFNLGGPTAENSSGRLGNECDTYGEFSYTKEFAKAPDGTSFVGTVMANIWSPGSSIQGDRKLSLNQYWVAAKNAPFLNGATAWIGNRFNNRPDVHMMDWQYVNMSGTGIGIEGVKAGPGKFSYALVRDDTDASTASSINHFIYDSLPLWKDTGLKLNLSVIGKDNKNPAAHSGYAFTAEVNQEKVLGGVNSVILQYGVGAGARHAKFGQVGNVTDDSSVTRIRVMDHLWWQVTPSFGGEAIAVYQRDKLPAGNETWTMLGARPVYALTDYLKLQLEATHGRVSPAGGGAARNLSKITFAPTLAAGKGYWARPELRTFVTHARWNKAAQASAAPGSSLSSTGVFGPNTSGTSFGFQVEAWW
jgi:maltoporin